MEDRWGKGSETWGALMNEGEGGSEVTAKGEDGMSKWHSQTGDAPPARENSEGTESSANPLRVVQI